MIAILKHNGGNTQSVQNALTRLGYQSTITDDSSILLTAHKVIFPGVGEASSAMKYLKQRGLDEVIKAITNPFLGICLGMQLMCKYSEEGDTDCLGLFETNVKKFPSNDKVPHMGWNNFEKLGGSLFSGVVPEDDLYYVHSYYGEVSAQTVATCDYILPFNACIESGNFMELNFTLKNRLISGDRYLKTF